MVNYLLKNGGFKVRGLTRKVDEPKAKALSAKGVEMVASDLNGSVDDISKAFQGAHGAFLVTQWGNGIDGPFFLLSTPFHPFLDLSSRN